jgi:hypothetical protein
LEATTAPRDEFKKNKKGTLLALDISILLADMTKEIADSIDAIGPLKSACGIISKALELVRVSPVSNYSILNRYVPNLVTFHCNNSHIVENLLN